MSHLSQVSRRIALTLASATIALSVIAAPVSAASVPAHSGTFQCSVDAAGHRSVSVNLPSVKGTTSLQQVWWYASVFKKVGTGYQFIGNTKTEYLTGFANLNGMISGTIIPGFRWTGATTNFGAINGGSVTVPSAGTYQVAGYFWWSGLSAAWTGDWATYYPTGQQACAFN